MVNVTVSVVVILFCLNSQHTVKSIARKILLNPEVNLVHGDIGECAQDIYR